MPRFTRFLSVFLAITLLASSVGLVSCSEPTIPDETGSAFVSTSEAESESPVDDRTNAKDDLPNDLDFGGATNRLLTRTGDEDTLREFVAENGSADVVSEAVHERNALVQDRLKVEMEIIPAADSRHSGSKINELVTKTVQSGLDEYDLVSNHLTQTTTLVVAGYFRDLNDYSYLNFEQPWWNSIFADELSVGDTQYLAVGELALSYISGMYAMFYSKTLWEEHHGADELYDLVENNEWTLDKLISFTTDYNRDLNGDGKIDDADVCGLYYEQGASIMSDAMAGAADRRFIVKEGDTFKFGLNNERTLEFAEKMKVLLYENNGTYVGAEPFASSLKKLSKDTALFTVNMLGGTTFLRDMENDYGIVPIPKLNASQETYTGYVHSGFSAFGIPTTVEDGDMVAAFMEAMAAETYRKVTSAYFDTALKVKYARDPKAAEMLDIISRGVVFDFGYVYTWNLENVGHIFRNLFSSSANAGKAASTFKSKERSTERAVVKFLETMEKNNKIE